MTQKRWQMVACISLLMLTAVSYMFRLFSASRTGVIGNGTGEQMKCLLLPALTLTIFYMGASAWHNFEKQDDAFSAKEKVKAMLVRLGIAAPAVWIFSILFQSDLQYQGIFLGWIGISIHWIAGIVLLLLVPYCLECIFQCWEEEGKEQFGTCFGTSVALTVLVFAVSRSCLTPYLVLYTGMYLILYLSMIWQSVRRKEMDLPQGVIAAFAITILVAAGIVLCLYPEFPYLASRLDGWLHPENWRHAQAYEIMRTMMTHSSAWGHYSYVPGMFDAIQYLEFNAAAIPMVVMYYGGWIPAIVYSVIVLGFAGCVGWGYWLMHKAQVRYLPVYRMIALFWILRSVLGLLHLFTLLPVNLALPFASSVFSGEDAALMGIFLCGLWGEHTAGWKHKIGRVFILEDELEFPEDLDELDEYDEDQDDFYDDDQNDFYDDESEWEELEEYGEV